MPPKRKAGTAIGPPSKRKVLSGGGTARRNGSSSSRVKTEQAQANPLKEEFIGLFQEQYKHGISNSQLKNIFRDRFSQLVSVINDLTKESRLSMSRVGDELFYTFISKDVAAKFAGLDVTARMIYQLIERSGNMGVWSKEMKFQSNIQTQALNKILKNLETRKLIKPVKSVVNDKRKLYMLFDTVPSKEITGGPWYTDREFDHEFIDELRTFIMLCVRRLNGGKGVCTKEIAIKMKEANVSRVELGLPDVQHLLQTLAFDYMIEQNGTNLNGEALFVVARKVSSACDFKWWEMLKSDFHFRDIRFEDDVVLSKHEPHHHTSPK
mmetsp:Transcript_4404/g.6723  ORF Transcript_4404/g.6723 Transcript_4404/m.6723 type:complete len:323 (+) Transcript_4404:20-988(+)